MNESPAADAVISMIPGWYRAKGGKLPLKLDFGDGQTSYVVREITPKMGDLKYYAEARSEVFEGFFETYPKPIATDIIQEDLALKWLQLTSPDIQWKDALAYFRELGERTYENATVIKNIIVTPNRPGTCSVTGSEHSKLFDVLSSSPYCALKVDKAIRFVDYFEIRWENIKDTADYKFHPEFLHPFHSILGDREFSIHHTARRDLIILGRDGIIATRRKSRWKLYDPQNLKNCLVDILSRNYYVGCNMYEILFDLSFRRHGALLIFDPLNTLSEQIVNTHAWIASNYQNPKSGHAILRDRVLQIKPAGWGKDSARDKSLFLELASVDGALVFSESGIKAFGAMIKTHPKATGQYGARATAALSAFLYGAHPMKVSADGDVRILFWSEDQDGKRHRAQLEFA